MFDKIRYRYVYNRKHRLNAQGRALMQLEYFKCKMFHVRVVFISQS